jgi:hypothetical protein
MEEENKIGSKRRFMNNRRKKQNTWHGHEKMKEKSEN